MFMGSRVKDSDVPVFFTWLLFELHCVDVVWLLFELGDMARTETNVPCALGRMMFVVPARGR